MGAHSWGAEGWGVQDIFLDKECQTRKISPQTRRMDVLPECTFGDIKYIRL
jgi:hypothetical protein